MTLQPKQPQTVLESSIPSLFGEYSLFQSEITVSVERTMEEKLDQRLTLQLFGTEETPSTTKEQIRDERIAVEDFVIFLSWLH